MPRGLREPRGGLTEAKAGDAVEAPETVKLRALLDRYLAGAESVEAVARQFVSLFGEYLEANYVAGNRGEPLLGDFEPADLTEDQRRRLRALWEHLGDDLPGPDIKYLPADDEGAV